MSVIYPLNPGMRMRHYIEAADSCWYAVFCDRADQVKYFHEGVMYHGTPEEFVKHHYAAVEPPRKVWQECEVLHEGVWKRNPTVDSYIDLTKEAEDDDEEIVLRPPGAAEATDTQFQVGDRVTHIRWNPPQTYLLVRDSGKRYFKPGQSRSEPKQGVFWYLRDEDGNQPQGCAQCCDLIRV